MMKLKNAGKILIWVGLLVFFIYSFQAIIDLEELTNPRRWESFNRIINALARPNIFDYEYETRETPIVFESDCQIFEGKPQILKVHERTIEYNLNCTNAQVQSYDVHGWGFQPNTKGSIYWFFDDDLLVKESEFKTNDEGQFSILVRKTTRDDGKFVIIEQIEKTFLGISRTSYETVERIWETIQIAFLATYIGAILAILLTYLSARNSSWWGRGLNFILQPILAAIRSVHPLVTGVMFVVLAGLGATAGTLALSLFSMAVLFGTYSEYASLHTNVGWSQFLKTHFPGLAFRHFPINITIATILGFMGGGGIGFMLQQNINLLNYRAASVQILAIIIIIASLDLLSRAIWCKIQNVD